MAANGGATMRHTVGVANTRTHSSLGRRCSIKLTLFN